MVASHWDLGLAAVKLVVGWMTVAILGATQPGGDFILPFSSSRIGLIFRFITILTVGVLANVFSEYFATWLGIDALIATSGLLLFVGGILQIGFSGSLLRRAGGILSVMCGFEIIFSPLSDSVLLAGLVALIHLGVGMAVTYWINLDESEEVPAMSAGFLWILLPLVFALLLLLFGQYPRVSMAIGAVVNTAIVITVLLLKVDHNYILGNTLIRIEPVFSILGRSILIDNADRVILLFLYGLSSLYLWLGVFFDSEPTFAPLSTSIAAFLAAAIFVESRLYFVLFVELAVLLCLPLLVKKAKMKEHGEQFLLIFVSLSVPLLLLAGWAADNVAANPIDAEMINRTVVFLVLGFSLMVGVFPFFFWMPQISETARPIRAFFVLSILPFTFLYLLYSVGDAGGWLRSNETLLHWLQVMGYTMIAFGGIWAAFQENLGRYIAFGLIVDNGFAFLAIQNGLAGDGELLFLLLSIRLIVLFLYTITVVQLDRHGIIPTIDGIRGKFIQFPFVFILLFFAIFSINALPLMANFTVRFSILQNLQTTGGVDEVVWPLIGQLGFFLGVLRFLGSAVETRENDAVSVQNETWPQRIVFLAGMLVLLVIGFLPSQATNFILGIWSAFGS